MRAIVEQDWARRGTYKIWLIEDTTIRRGTMLMRIHGDGTREWEQLPPEGAERPQPTLELHELELKALLAELSGVLPATDATVEHLKDAREVRDRMISLVGALVEHEIAGGEK